MKGISKFNINDFKQEDTAIINNLFPEAWNFNFHYFIEKYFLRSFFKGFTISDRKNTIGFGNLLVFDKTCWLGNIVIDENYRNLGLGSRLTTFLIDYGKKIGIETFTLIATELGIPIYKKLGFIIDQEYSFFTPGDNIKKNKPEKEIKIAEKKDINEILDLDLVITNEKRNLFLDLYLSQTFVISDKTENIMGIYIKGLGNGLVLARESEFGLELLKQKILDKSSQIVIPSNNFPAIKYLQRSGFKKNIIAPRMIFGNKLQWKPETIFSRGTPFSG